MSDAIEQARVHNIKCDHGPFLDVKAGRKPFEVRKNDRDYRVGDTLRMTDNDTGETLDVVVSYMLPGGQYGIAEGYVVLALLSGVPDVEALAKRLICVVVPDPKHRETVNEAAATLRAQAAQLAVRPAPEDAKQAARLRSTAKDYRASGHHKAAYAMDEAADRIEALSAQVAEVTRERDGLSEKLCVEQIKWAAVRRDIIAAKNRWATRSETAHSDPMMYGLNQALAIMDSFVPITCSAPAPDVLAQVEADDGWCHAARSDGECFWQHCPQLRDSEPHSSGRSCPRKWYSDDEESEL